jgi:hypothetical protein
MKWTARIATLLFLTLTLTTMASAQGVQYGSVAGVVTDASGDTLPGVSVTASSSNLQGTRTVVTDAAGRYRITPLPAGSYAIAFELSMFQTHRVQGVVVNLGTSTEVNARLQVAAVAESVTVTASSVVLDTTKSTIDTSIPSELADTLPTSRDFTELMEMAPRMESGLYAPLSGGQSNTSNLFLVDGVDTTDPRVQIWGTMINWDTIAETQLQTAAFTAEYGRAPGAVLNLVTKSGGNAFHGTLRVVESRESWSSDPGRDSETGRLKAGGAQTEETRPSITLGGPIVRDRLWFFGAYERRDQSAGFARYANLDDALAGTLSQERSAFEGHYGSVKLTWQAHQKHSIVAFYNEDPTVQSPAQAFINGPIFSPDTERDQEMGGENISLQWTGILSDSLFMEAKYQDHSNQVVVRPTSPTFNSIPYTYDLAWNYAFGGPSVDYRSFRDREGILISGTKFLNSESWGAHEMKGGVEVLDIAPNTSFVWNAAGRYWNWLGGPYVKFLYLDQEGFSKAQQDYNAIYLQDQWRKGNLTLNVGVRAESTAIHNNRGDEIVAFDFGEQLAPRLGFAYDLKGDSIHGSVSRYYHLATNYIGDAFNQTTDHVQRWDWNYTCDPASAAYYAHPDACWSMLYDVPVDAGGTTIEPALNPSHLDEITLGYARRIGSQLGFAADFVWRWQDDQIDWYDPTASGIAHITNVPTDEVSGVDKWSEYQALSLSLQKRLGPDGFQFLASYTYAMKNDAWGVTWRDIGQYTFSNPESLDPLRYGRTHSPHRVKFFGSYALPWRTIVGLSTFWYSGNLYTATRPGTYGAVFIEERGSSKVGNNWEADLYLEQPFSVGPFQLSIYGNAFNLFDNQQVTARNGSSTLETFRDPMAWQAPRRVEFGVKFEF